MPACLYMHPRCPECKSTDTAKIVYGNLTSDALDEVKESGGSLTLGGCCIESDSKQYECNKCGHQWGKLEPDDDED